jgi:hypothetical protein
LVNLQKLEEKRCEASRPEELDDLSREQLMAEKVALQKALLHLESLHGRPATKGDRDLVRPLYDRYRSLKRLVIRSGGVSCTQKICLSIFYLWICSRFSPN